MSSPRFKCSKCRERFDEADVSNGRAICPSCGARVLKKAESTEPERDDENDESEDSVQRPTGKKKKASSTKKKKKAETPWVLVGGLALLGVCAVVVWIVFFVARKSDPQTQANAEGTGVPIGAGQPNGTIVQPSFALNSEPTKPPQPLEKTPPELTETIFLLPEDTPDGGALLPNPFERELARQSLWLAAQEECGLRVRDSSLGDASPKMLPGDRQFRIRYSPTTPTPWSVVAGTPGKEHKFWSGFLLMDMNSVLSPNLTGFEQLSREFFPKCLKAAGFAAKPNQKSGAPVPAEAEEALGEMREIAQFAAVRRLHAEIRAKGESDALIAGLVRGYANLGLLTEFHWSSAPFVFKARALLYAQRLLARSPQSAFALYLRAYACALAGLHAQALQDLAAAQKLAVDQKTSLPEWIEPIDAYLHFDLDRLAAARKKTDTPFVRLLQFLAVDAPETQAATIQAARTLLTTDPECYCVHDSLCRVGGVAHLHGATLGGIAIFTRSLPQRLKDLPELPETVKNALDEKGFEPGVYTALREAGGTTDRGEPSWTALGDLLQEVRFTQAWHRLIFMAQSWGVDTEEDAAVFSRLLEGHRLRVLIDSFTFDPRRAPGEVRKRLLAAPMSEVDMKAVGYYFQLQKVDPESATNWLQRANIAQGGLYSGHVRRARIFVESNANPREIAWVAKEFVEASPHAPYGQALTAILGGPEVVAKLAEMEKKYANHAVVQWGIGRRHLADQRRADAIRCWKRWVELSPSGESFRKLAEVYLAVGDENRWRETLEASLKEEDTGLFHAQVQVDLARYYMRKKDFKRAEPYAMAAAESFAEWALICAAECQEGLGKWDKANALYEAATERYEQTAYVWYFSCRAAGKMNRTAAERAVHGYIARFGTGTTEGELFRAGRFYQLAGDLKTARQLIERSNQLGGGGLTLLFAALLADAAGDTKNRDMILSTLAKLPDNRNNVRAIGHALEEWIAAGKVPDTTTVDSAVSKLPPKLRPNGDFYFGWYLHNRKLEDRAVELWKRCLESNDGTLWLKTHARAFMTPANQKKD